MPRAIGVRTVLHTGVELACFSCRAHQNDLFVLVLPASLTCIAWPLESLVFASLGPQAHGPTKEGGGLVRPTGPKRPSAREHKPSGVDRSEPSSTSQTPQPSPPPPPPPLVALLRRSHGEVPQARPPRRPPSIHAQVPFGLDPSLSSARSASLCVCRSHGHVCSAGRWCRSSWSTSESRPPSPRYVLSPFRLGSGRTPCRVGAPRIYVLGVVVDSRRRRCGARRIRWCSSGKR